MPVKSIQLLVTDHCSLCDQALQVLLDTSALAGTRLVTTDVVNDDGLFERYATRVPVLRCGAAELDWPFNVAAVSDWLAEVKN